MSVTAARKFLASGVSVGIRDAVDLSVRQVSVGVDLLSGQASATTWTDDLTAASVHENSAYSS
ncbi:hypothetical protein [Streptomyces sp. NPDC002564]|uniref:hypothetical protein n=1 Tax=Streptomyces sp. NPDC002564 TaxID=3364649 RepID=UPI00368A0DE5